MGSLRYRKYTCFIDYCVITLLDISRRGYNIGSGFFTGFPDKNVVKCIIPDHPGNSCCKRRIIGIYCLLFIFSPDCGFLPGDDEPDHGFAGSVFSFIVRREYYSLVPAVSNICPCTAFLKSPGSRNRRTVNCRSTFDQTVRNRFSVI